jgi:hypothetical protein
MLLTICEAGSCSIFPNWSNGLAAMTGIERLGPRALIP